MRRHSGFKRIVTHAIAVLTLVAAALSAQAERIPSGTPIVVRNASTLNSASATTDQRRSGTLVPIQG